MSAEIVTLRTNLYGREGKEESERQLAAGRRPFAVERRTVLSQRPLTTIVLATCVRVMLVGGRALVGGWARKSRGGVSRAAEITSGLDEAVEWPFLRAAAEEAERVVEG